MTFEQAIRAINKKELLSQRRYEPSSPPLTLDSRSPIMHQDRATSEVTGQANSHLEATVDSFFLRRIEASSDVWLDQQADTFSEDGQAPVHSVPRRIRATELQGRNQGEGDRSEIDHFDASQRL